jgi:hypothetical protein
MSLIQPFTSEVWAAFLLCSLLAFTFVMLYGAFYPSAEHGSIDFFFFVVGMTLDASRPDTGGLKSVAIRELTFNP